MTEKKTIRPFIVEVRKYRRHSVIEAEVVHECDTVTFQTKVTPTPMTDETKN